MTLGPVYMEVNTRYQWQKWLKDLDSGTYVLDHDKDMWHRIHGRIKPSRSCMLHLRVLRKLATWDGSKVMVRHAPDNKLWVTVGLPNHFCGTCNRRTKPHRTECRSCAMKKLHRTRPFYPTYTMVSIEVESGKIEMAYRVFKTLKKKHKLAVTHLDCTKPDKCRHITTYFHNYRATLPPRTSKVVGNVTEIARIL